MKTEYFPKDSIKSLTAPQVAKNDYQFFHMNLPILCHDIFIAYGKGILLVQRDNEPAKGLLWPIGGRVQRGVSLKDSIAFKVKEECNLEINRIQELGWGRTLFNTDPFGHCNGTDTLNIVFFAKGEGKLKLDNLHSMETIVTLENHKKISKDLHPYVKDFLKKALRKIKQET